jgi:hypothetical protein
MEIGKLIQEFGFPIAMVIGMAGYIYYLHRLNIKEREGHREERNDWRKSYEKNIETNKDVGNILAGVKSLLESLDRRKP